MKSELLQSLKELAAMLQSGDSGLLRLDTPHDIVDARGKLQLTQEEFAEKLNVSVWTVRSWEQGLRKPSIVSLLALAKLCQTQQHLENELVG